MRPNRELLLLLTACFSGSATGQEWTRFRGPDGQGIAPAERLPSTFAEENILWRVPTGGKGHSSPVLWENHLFLTREGPKDGVREVVCFDPAAGAELWAHESSVQPYDQHQFNSFASSTPTVGGDGVYVAWTSGDDLIALALDHDGERRWRRRLGTYRARHGSGASPILHGDLLIVANENEGDDNFLVALERDTGAPRWTVPRRKPDRFGSYSTPVVYRPEDGPPVLVFASPVHGLTGVDPESGEVVWEADLGIRSRCVATPALAGNLAIVFAGTGGGGKDCIVVRLPEDSAGEPEVLHRPRRNLPYVPSALALEDRFYLFADGGIATCLDATTGEVSWRERLEASFFSSPVSNGEAIFIADREGTLYSLAPGDRFRVLGTLDLGEPVFATPAITGGRMYVRTSDHLLCLGTPGPGKRE